MLFFKRVSFRLYFLLVKSIVLFLFSFFICCFALSSLFFNFCYFNTFDKGKNGISSSIVVYNYGETNIPNVNSRSTVLNCYLAGIKFDFSTQ